MNFQYSPLRQDQVLEVVTKIPLGVLQHISELDDVAIVGGAIRSMEARPREEIKDLDLVVVGDDLNRPEQVAFDLVKCVSAESVEMPPTAAALSVFPNSYQIEHPALPFPIQVLKRVRPSLVETLESFDFSITQAGIWFDPGLGGQKRQWRGLANDIFAQDVKRKILRYGGGVEGTRDAWAGTVLVRAFKFSRRGYKLLPDSMARIVKETYEGMEPWFERTAQESWGDLLSGEFLGGTSSEDWIYRFMATMAECGVGGST
jgi:hypothetical protein